MGEKASTQAGRRAGSEWFALPLMILIEVYLKMNAYGNKLQKYHKGQILSLAYGEYEVLVEWGYHENKGSAMWLIVGGGWNSDFSWYFSKVAYFFAMCGAAYLIRYVFTNPVPGNLRYGSLFLAAGALGNLVDRLSIGAVVDYWYLRVLLPIFPKVSLFFNLSDLYIDVAFVSLIIAMIRDDFGLEKAGGAIGNVVIRYFANGAIQDKPHPTATPKPSDGPAIRRFSNGIAVTAAGEVADEISTESKKMR
jgi:lipoprotein signal peptidase